MRKLSFIIVCFLFSVLLNAQNGFESLDPGVNFTNYAIDQEGNYWLHSLNKLYKFNEIDGLTEYTQSNTNLSYSFFRDIIVQENNVYIITDSKVFLFNSYDPSQCEDLGFDGSISKAFYDNGQFFLFATTQSSDLKIYIYNGSEWEQGDELPFFNTINGAAYFNGNYFLSVKDKGLFKYDGKLFDTVSEAVFNDLQVWKGVLWFIGPRGVYNYLNDTINLRTALSEINGGEELVVMNGELWAGGYNQIKKIDFDRIQAFELPGTLKCLPRCNPDHDAVEMAIGNKLYTFNENEYTSDPTFVTPENLRFLDVNNAEVAYNTRNSIFWDLNNNAQYKVPKDGDASSLFASSLWFGGKDPDGNLHVSADIYNFEDRFKPGPLRLDDAQTDENVMDQFNRIWKVDRATIENFRYRFQNGEVQNGNWPIDYDIASWPAHGPDGYAESLAPFVDVNEDGIYNPMDGDYPDITGDQMLYWIINDFNGGTPLNNEELSFPLGVEVHCKAWANVYENANSDELEAVNNTTFLDVEIINRSDTAYSDFYAGIWTEGDLGYPDDDYVGCDVMNHSYYFYNGDPYDDVGGYFQGYGEYPPAQSVTFLDAPVKYTLPEVDTGIYMSSFIYHQFGDNEVGNPVFASDYYNYMTAKWKDSADLTYGGNGVSTTDVACRFMYPGDSDPYNIGTGGIAVPGYDQIWTNPAAVGFPSDVLGVAANGPYTLAPGESVTYRYAFVWARDTVNTEITASADKLRSLLPYSHQWQREGEFPSNYNIHIVPIGINEQTATALGVKLYPNPANNTVTLTCDATNAQYRIYSLSGRLMKAGQIRNNSHQISLDHMNRGLYMVQITNGKISVTEKLIVE